MLTALFIAFSCLNALYLFILPVVLDIKILIMKKNVWSVLFWLSVGLMASCSTEKKEQNDSALNVETQNTEMQKEAEQTELKQTYTAEFGNRHYDIHMKRTSAVDLPKVVDEFGTESYDNRVEIILSSEGKALYEKSFTKENFLPYLKENEKKETILLGMAYDASHSDSKSFCFGAQIGLPGVEEGPAFRVFINMNNGAVTIERDIEQDTTGDAGLAE